MVKVKREWCQENNIPVISEATENFLKDWISTYQPQYVGEIGSAIGYSTSILAEAISIYTDHWWVDSREISYPHYRQSVLNTSHYKNVTVYLWNICHINLEKCVHKEAYNLLFVDGRKSETLDYLILWNSYIRSWSTIIIDDVIKFKEKMRNCYDFLDNNKIPYTVKQLDSDDGILILPVTLLLLQALYELSDHP